MKEIEILKSMNACDDAIEWLEKQSRYEQSWRDCHRGDWMLWLIKKTLDGSDDSHRKFTMAKARCARTVLHLMRDERSKKSVLVAERYGEGKATLEELKAAADSAYDAYVAAAYASYASYAAYATYATYAAYTAYTAADADADVDAADAAADAAAAYTAADANARKENQMLTANIVRELYSDPPALAARRARRLQKQKES